jgi:hypothetical protein
MAVEITLSYPPDAVTIRSTPFGAVITLNGAGGVGEPGEPGLPRAVVRVALPPGAVATGVRAEVLATHSLSRQPVLVAPVQVPRAGGVYGNVEPKQSLYRRGRTVTSEALPQPPVTLPDEAAYRRALESPRPLVRLLSKGDAQTPVATVEVNPVALDADGALRLSERVALFVDYEVLETEHVRAQWLDRSTARYTSPAQVYDHMTLIRQLVVNPSDVVLNPNWHNDWFLGPAEYLVITDRNFWDAATITAGDAVPGDPIAEFDRLVHWKRARGLTARMVTVSDIVAGHHGDFRTGARDLPEVIRNFLKHARSAWGTRWLLIGGDVGIVPAREVDGEIRGDIAANGASPPAAGSSHWTGSRLHINTAGIGEWWGADASNTLIRTDTGRVVPYDHSIFVRFGSVQPLPYWYFATDDTYATRSLTPTDFVVVRGSQAQVDGPYRFLYHWNRIPTDFYYSSLVGPGYDQPGRHDWDFRDNGVYGEHADADADDADKITWQAQVSVGRAPITSGAEAATFVNKVLAYEQLPEAGPFTFGHVYERDMVVVGSSWGGRVGVSAAGVSLDDNEFTHDVGSNHTVIQLTTGEVPITYALYSYVSDTDIRYVPYDATVAAGGRGWHYCVSATDLSPSVFTLDLFGQRFRIPVPSRWIVVYSNDATDLAPTWFILDEPAADGSMLDQEQIVDIAYHTLRGITSVERLYEDVVDLPAGRPSGAEYLTQTRLTDRLNQGPHFVSLSGHGNPGGVAGLDPWVARSLNNGLPGFIGYADSCLTGDFADSGWDVMNKALLNNTIGGVAYVGSTRFSWIGQGDDFQRLFWARLATNNRLGAMVDSKVELVHAAGLNTWCSKWTIMALTLHGDPEMPIWNRVPRRLKLPVFKERIPWWEWPIRDEQGRVVPYGVVTVRIGEHVLTARADANGNATLDPKPVEHLYGHMVAADVTVTADGYRPVVRTVALEIVEPDQPREEEEPAFVEQRAPEAAPEIDEGGLTRDFIFVVE